MSTLIATILLTGCLHWVELIQTIENYSNVQIEYLKYHAQNLPPKDFDEVIRAIIFIRKARAQGLDPVTLAKYQCNMQDA